MALLPDNIKAFGEGLDVPADEVRLYLGLRESARARLFAHVPWLGPQLLGAVEAYARGIRIDSDAIESAMREVDGSDPASIQQALAEGLFEPDNTPAQEAALTRLETLLALVEGWVEQVADTAARDRLPHADAMRETVRRRRAAGGPAEHTFASLVGLELRPRRLREAAALWGALPSARGAGGPGRGLGPPRPAADGGGPGRPGRVRRPGPVTPRRTARPSTPRSKSCWRRRRLARAREQRSPGRPSTTCSTGSGPPWPRGRSATRSRPGSESATWPTWTSTRTRCGARGRPRT